MGKLFITEKKIKELLCLSAEDPRDHALLQTLVSTGLKIGDVLRLRCSDVFSADDGIVETLRIKIEKKNIEFERPLREDTRKALEVYLKARKDQNPWFFVGRYRKNQSQVEYPLSRSSAHLIIKKYLGLLYPQIVIKDCSTNVLRQSMGRLLWEKTGRIEAASKWLGHSSVAQTKAYLEVEDLTDEEINEVVASFDI